MMHTGRRGFMLGTLAAGCVGTARAQDTAPPPIVFVHGNGDTAGLWLTMLWRFETNLYPRDRLFALDLRYPTARTRDDTPEPGRSSAHDVMEQLAAEVTRVRALTGAPKVILVAQSRGGNTVRNYLKNGDGAARTEIAVLCGAVNHGIIVSDKYLLGSEFNGASPFMIDLNSTPKEVLPGVRYATIRSDRDDKFAQPDGRYLGFPGVPTGLSFNAPDLRGATKFVLPGVDHRETGYSPEAFATMYGFITGGRPRTIAIAAEQRPVLTGKVSAFEAGAPTNIAIAGA
ncbi:MAG: alpha/beta fold hydrolase, partial [Acetobacteraceae bacterium]